jgi:hypothetical protein
LAVLAVLAGLDEGRERGKRREGREREREGERGFCVTVGGPGIEELWKAGRMGS